MSSKSASTGRATARTAVLVVVPGRFVEGDM
jgi:hypothetical protein